MKAISRRSFLATTAATATLSACGINSPTPEDAKLLQFSGTLCDDRSAAGPLRIDMHCHFLNLRDLSAGPFVARRALNFDESNVPGLDAAAGIAVGGAARVLRVTTEPTSDETGHLRYELKTPETRTLHHDPTQFCQYAERYQDGIFKAKKRNQLTGVFSNKVRNAGRIAEVYPSIDIFMPSMVDLYDDRRSMNSIDQQISFYESLNLVTGGRYLPMVSYNPQRQYQAQIVGHTGGEAPYLDQVKEAISKKGFIGVKLHPSSGFSPLNNLRYGCVNTATQIVNEDDQQLYDRFVAYDQLLDTLYKFCAENDVPILTHGSTGITSNRRCMRGPRGSEAWTERPSGPRGTGDREWRYLYRDWGRIGGKDSELPLEWTNAPDIWDQVARKYKVKVIISHFSDSLKVDETRNVVQASPWLMRAAEICNNNSNVYMDLSIITEFFYLDKPSGAEPSYRIRPGYCEVFAELNRRFPKLRKQLLYGTDWHMPHTAYVGADFLPLVETLLDQSGLGDEKDAIMGTRAADVFGLQSGRQNRKRLETFYAARGAHFTGQPLTTDDIAWMRKLG